MSTEEDQAAGSSASAETVKTIKRYANRKLYDTDRSCYVTLDDIREMICAGDEVRVIDNKTGEDLTTVTMTQIIFEREKEERGKGRRLMPIGLLRELIQGGPATSVQEGAQHLKEGADRIRHQVLRKGEERLKSAQDLFKGAHSAIDELQKGVESKVNDGVGAVTREFTQLRNRLGDLEQKFRGRGRGGNSSDQETGSTSSSES